MKKKNDSKFEIAVKVRVKHGLIYGYMREHGLTWLEMTKKIGISTATFSKILHFKWVPGKYYQNKKTAEKLCNFFQCDLEDILPNELAQQIKNNLEIAKLMQEGQTVYKEVDIEYLSYDEVSQGLLVYDPRPEFEKIDLRKNLERVLKTLTPREEKVIKMRFGIGDENEYTLEEVGTELGVTRQRIIEIEAKAIRKIKHPSRAKFLKEFK